MTFCLNNPTTTVAVRWWTKGGGYVRPLPPVPLKVRRPKVSTEPRLFRMQKVWYCDLSARTQESDKGVWLYVYIYIVWSLDINSFTYIHIYTYRNYSRLNYVELEGTTLLCMDPNYWFIVAFCDLHPKSCETNCAVCTMPWWSVVLGFRDCFWEIVGWNGRFTRKTCSNVLFASICNIWCNTSFWESEPNLPEPRWRILRQQSLFTDNCGPLLRKAVKIL